MSSTASIFTDRLPAAEAAKLPAAWCVALLTGENDVPIQLLCTKNLRRSVLKRLLPHEHCERTRRANLTPITQNVFFTRVDGLLEMELHYMRAAASVFPNHWRKIVPDRPCYFVQVDVDSAHPNYHRLDRLPEKSNGLCVGPFLMRSKADDFVDTIREQFDLCRQHELLRQAPHARACAYKQMHKCPAPCDGTVPMSVYRDNVRQSLRVFGDSELLQSEWLAQMHAHAKATRFEQAAKLKRQLKSLAQLSQVKSFDDFRFIVIDRGNAKPEVKLFVIRGATVVAASDAGQARSQLAKAVDWPVDEVSHRRLAMLCHFMAHPEPAIIVTDPSMLDAQIARAIDELWPKKVAKIQGNDQEIRQAEVPLDSG